MISLSFILVTTNQLGSVTASNLIMQFWDNYPLADKVTFVENLTLQVSNTASFHFKHICKPLWHYEQLHQLFFKIIPVQLKGTRQTDAIIPIMLKVT